ncbi:polysaccharide biosynthesis C-terminal domain-containing protein [Arenimonas sp.]|uniref:oligosaccharide flippase family protein n=1 Tax=Arenimonas sp. TaxID=1872635 RepID=UPI0039E39AE3
MSPPEAHKEADLAAWNGAWVLGTRLIAMAIGLLGLPILMSALGLLQFGAWAVLLGGTFAFGTLELGMSVAVMRWTTLSLMPESKINGGHGLSAIMSNSLACTALVFAGVGIPLYFVSEPLAAWLQLPMTALLTPGQCILVIYATVATMALLRCTIAPMLAARRMAVHSGFALLQSVVGAAVIWTVAWTTRRLDLVILSNAVAIVAVQLFAAAWTRRRMPWRFSRRTLDRRLASDMLRFGAALQFSDLSTFVMYQFDKLVISGVVAPTEVAHYEVASRSAQALGNVSSAPFVAFAPTLTERHGRNEDVSADLLRMLRLTVFGSGVFLLLPLAVAPIGLFAWIGQIGYHAATTFALLALAVISTVLIMPLSMTAQAQGRARLEFARAFGAMLVNVPCSFLLIHAYGKEGAALGTLLACLLGNSLFAWWLFRSLGLSWARVLAVLQPFALPIAVVTGATMAVAQWVEPWVIVSRWYMAPTAVVLYATGAVGLMLWLWRRALQADERAMIASLPARLFRARPGVG